MVLTFVAQNIQHGGWRDGEGSYRDRWPKLVERITSVEKSPDFVLLSEAREWNTQGHRALARAMNDLSMDGLLAPSVSGQSVALLYRSETVGRWQRWNTDFINEVTHSFGVGSFDVGLPALLSVVPLHLDPFRKEKAIQEVGLISSRGYRYGPFAVIGGDVNYPPSRGPEPDYKTMKPFNVSARTILGDPRKQQKLEPDRRVGWAFEKAGYVDVAYHLYEKTGDETLLQRTATDDRIDQFWVTTPLAPAITAYHVLQDPPKASDHKGIMLELDTDLIDISVPIEDY